jgi:hypothetical protein
MAQTNNNIDNLGEIRPDAVTNANVSPTQLPIRGEKRIINAPIDTTEASIEFIGEAPIKYADTGRTQPVDADDFAVHAALSPYVDYVVVRLYNRGLGGNGQPDGQPAAYRFLINPSQVVVNRTTLDGQALARSGWQVGVWGEDSFTINLTGKTAGQYFAFGTTDRYQPFTESYRNLEQLQVVFENNGYWFEGEQAAEGPLGADFARRIIKMHADVELIVGNFQWYGMFESLTLSQNAETPFLMDFQISFIAWKERFRKQSPYKDTIHNDVKRGHDYGTWLPSALAVQQPTQQIGASQAVTLTPNTATTTTPVSTMIPPLIARPVPTSVQAAQDANTYPQVSPDANDTTYNTQYLDYTDPENFGLYNGVVGPLPYANGGKTT